MFKLCFVLQRSFGNTVLLDETPESRGHHCVSTWMTFISLVKKETSIETVGSHFWDVHKHFPTHFPFSVYRQFMQLMTNVNFGELFSARHFQRLSTIYLIRQEVWIFFSFWLLRTKKMLSQIHSGIDWEEKWILVALRYIAPNHHY